MGLSMAYVRNYVLAGAGAIGLWTAGEVFAWELAPAQRQSIAPSMRQSPGGWRSWTFWHSGLHGGK